MTFFAEPTVNAFVGFLNSIHPELGFTLHCSKKEVSFLDTRIKKDDQDYKTDISKAHRP